MRKKREFAFGAVVNGHLWHWSISAYAHQVREKVGRSWADDNVKLGWKAARIETGVMVQKIEVVFSPR